MATEVTIRVNLLALVMLSVGLCVVALLVALCCGHWRGGAAPPAPRPLIWSATGGDPASQLSRPTFYPGVGRRRHTLPHAVVPRGAYAAEPLGEVVAAGAGAPEPSPGTWYVQDRPVEDGL